MSGTIAGMAEFLTEPVPHKQAANYIRDKIIVGNEIFNALPQRWRNKAFATAATTNWRILDRIREACAQVPEGADWEETRSNISDDLMSDNLTCLMFEGSGDENAEANCTRQAELIMRMNIGQAYSATKTEVLDKHADVFPYRQYLCMEDGKVRPSHAALHGLIFPADHPFWETHTPPWDFNCRCTIAGVMADEVDEIADEEQDLPPEQSSVLDEGTLDAIDKTGMLVRGNQVFDIRTPAQKKPGGYEWSPRAVSQSAEEIVSQLSPETREEFVAWARETIVPEGGQTVWEWMGGRV